MSKLFALFAFTCLLSLTTLAQEQANQGKSSVERAQEVLQQARVALGGETNLKTIQSLSASGEYKSVAGQRLSSGQIKFDLLLPDKYLKTVSVTPNQLMQITTLEAVNGTEVWNDRKVSNTPAASGSDGFGGGAGGGGGPGGGTGGGGALGGGAGGIGGGAVGIGGRGGGRGGPGSGVPLPSGGSPGRLPEFDPQMQAVMQARTRAEYARLVTTWLLTAPSSLPLEFSYDRELDTKDGKADALRVTGADDFQMWLIFAQATRRPLMLIYRETRLRRPSNDAEEAAREPQTIDIQLYLRDYKQVNNVWLPHQIVKASNNQLIEEWKLKYKLNPNLKHKTFEKPQK